jgi:glycosyltransferase involved in cell wall biosynthesis
MKKKPLISVSIATYNRAHLLPRAINSVLNQTYQNFELIIIDDGSTDQTKEVIKSFTDERIIYFRHEKNMGYLTARNTGWNIAKGHYNCQLGDDDELLPNALESIVTKFYELSLKGVRFLWFDMINAETETLGGSGLKNEGFFTYEDILSGKIQGDFFIALDMEFIGQNRFDNHWQGGDGILWLRFLRKTKAYYVPKILYKAYREHGSERESNKTRTNMINHITGVYLYEKTFLEENGENLKLLRPVVYGQRLNKFGWYLILNDELYEGRKTLFTSFKYNFSFIYIIIFFISFIMRSKQIKIFYKKFFNID